MNRFRRLALALWGCAAFLPVSWAQRQDPIPLNNWAAPLYWRAPVPDQPADLPAYAATNIPRAADTSGQLSFVAIQPCRPVDTRGESGQTGAFGPPIMTSGAKRDFALWSSPKCVGLPSSARAYSVNVTVLPSGPLGYLTLWPAGSPQPFVSTLNSFTGTVVSNAAIVPAGTNGSISAFVTDQTHLIIDVNGFYTDMAGIGGTAGPTGPTGPMGPAGPMGPGGTVGPTGAVGPQGPPILFRGAWVNTTLYATGDSVSFAGSSYIALTGNLGQQPGLNPFVWGLLAQMGATGTTGATGPTGPASIVPGPTGATGATGAMGPTGPTGPSGSGGLAAYGSFSNDSGPIVAVILGGTSIPLSTTTASLNISYSGTTATIANAGVYKMSYCVRTTATLNMSSRLLVNGAGVTSSAISPPQGSDKFCRATTLSLAAGTTVDLQLWANPSVAASLLSPGGAEMLIEQLGPLVP